MAIENGSKAEAVPGHAAVQSKGKWKDRVLVVLRVATVLAASTAALLMGLNKQSISKAVAIVGTTTVRQTYTAKFQQTPEFVYFVVANAIVGLYNLVVLILMPYKWKPFRFAVHLMDLVMFAVAITGASAAAAMAELGKNGNLSARWSPICDQFGQFCLRGGLAIAASFLGAFLLMIVIAITTVTLYRKISNN